jgi:hypothetical protein
MLINEKLLFLHREEASEELFQAVLYQQQLK